MKTSTSDDVPDLLEEKSENRVPMSVTVLPSTKSLVKRLALRANTTSSRMTEILLLEAAEVRRRAVRPSPRKKPKGKKS